ncbi:MAG: extracellular solute-binding protein [Methylococcaceae bacterium]|nr:extracellular solute-binding protein [Methylococcaceae bacterium]
MKTGNLLCLIAFLSLAPACILPAGADPVVLQFWAMGREGELVRQLLPDFERRNPGVTVKVQQIPWSAAHEKLLTAYAGDALPDVFQLGTTWIPEFVALRALEPFPPEPVHQDFFPAILAANQLDGKLWCLPWYADTRVLFYRRDLLAQVGWPEPPRTWQGWLEAMDSLRRLNGDRYAILAPANEWELPTILALQQGAKLLRDRDRYGDFGSPTFRGAIGFYLNLFRHGLAPTLAQTQIANLYQEFAEGYFAIYLSGPWNLGEFRRRLPESMQDAWSTAPLPAFDGPGPGLSLAGGAGLAVSVRSPRKEAAAKLVAFLAEPTQQLRFYRLSGDLPPGRMAWDDPLLAADSKAKAFRIQLDHLAALPKIPEWERIAAKLARQAERMVRGELDEKAALDQLDQAVDGILEKRRWLLDRQR